MFWVKLWTILAGCKKNSLQKCCGCVLYHTRWYKHDTSIIQGDTSMIQGDTRSVFVAVVGRCLHYNKIMPIEVEMVCGICTQCVSKKCVSTVTLCASPFRGGLIKCAAFQSRFGPHWNYSERIAGTSVYDVDWQGKLTSLRASGRDTNVQNRLHRQCALVEDTLA